MELSRTVAFAAIFFIVVLVLTSGRAYGDDNKAHQRKLAAIAAENMELREIAARERRERQAAALRARNIEFGKRCRIKSVMTDGEIMACRVAMYSM